MSKLSYKINRSGIAFHYRIHKLALQYTPGSLGDDVDVVPVVIHVDEGGLLSVVGWGLLSVVGWGLLSVVGWGLLSVVGWGLI